MEEYKLLNKKTAYKGKVLDFADVEIGLPGGETTHWDLLTHPGGAAVVPIDNDGNIIMERQYRVGADDYLLEIPAGKSEPNEDTLTTIKREMKEEIGCVTDDIELLLTFRPAPAYSEECTDIYVARNLTDVGARPDSDEFLEIERVSLDDAIRMILNQEITDGKTIAAIMAFATKQKL